jgi:hypothetical protein
MDKACSRNYGSMLQTPADCTPAPSTSGTEHIHFDSHGSRELVDNYLEPDFFAEEDAFALEL